MAAWGAGECGVDNQALVLGYRVWRRARTVALLQCVSSEFLSVVVYNGATLSEDWLSRLVGPLREESSSMLGLFNPEVHVMKQVLPAVA